ncbi:hypothetical protein [Methylobacterium oryzihabitans]|uniref:Uncharacterized protein n=1 Tax=Methylobacterium oryzihabitans TaxID=2499852 RepID=A0A437P5B8_9HYPH|nr:hypothetical protein [Methylobacterium oryzihabitans]RVU17471.1 hypothetical protein EOE48_13875 [Methylobacterium oryzihabitans]
MTEPLSCLELHAAILGVAAYQSARDAACEAAEGAATAVGDALERAAGWSAGIVECLPEIPALFASFSVSGTSSPEAAPVAAPTPASWEIAVGQSSESPDPVWPERWTNWQSQIDAAGMVRWLRSTHPSKTAACVAADLGVPVDTVTKWLAREALPNGRTVVLMTCVYGPEFLAALLHHPPDWLDAAVRQADLARLHARLAALRGELAQRGDEARPGEPA